MSETTMSVFELTQFINRLEYSRQGVAELWRIPKLTREVGSDLFLAMESLKRASMILSETRHSLYVGVGL